jgi:hypothetical protein
MNNHSIMKGTVLVLCIIGMLVLPAAAAPSGQAATGKGTTIDQGLKDDLWANHQHYRLEIFDMNINRAGSVITILNKYGVDTTSARNTLSTITGKRPALEAALSARDREGLKTVNADLMTLWKQFRTDIREAIRAHYDIPASTGAGQSTTPLSADVASAGV